MTPALSPRERALILRVCDGAKETLPWLFIFHQHRRSEEVFCWLITMHLTGKEFAAWIKDGHGGSPMTALASVIAALERDKIRPILVGRDFRA